MPRFNIPRIDHYTYSREITCKSQGIQASLGLDILAIRVLSRDTCVATYK